MIFFYSLYYLLIVVYRYPTLTHCLCSDNTQWTSGQKRNSRGWLDIIILYVIRVDAKQKCTMVYTHRNACVFKRKRINSVDSAWGLYKLACLLTRRGRFPLLRHQFQIVFKFIRITRQHVFISPSCSDSSTLDSVFKFIRFWRAKNNVYLRNR